MAVWGGGEVLPYISHIGMCRRKGRGFVPFRPEIRVTTTLRPLPPTPLALQQGTYTSGASDIKFEIGNQVIWLKERMQYEQVSISFVLDKKRDLEYIFLTQETLTLLNSSKSWPFFFFLSLTNKIVLGFSVLLL